MMMMMLLLLQLLLLSLLLHETCIHTEHRYAVHEISIDHCVNRGGLFCTPIKTKWEIYVVGSTEKREEKKTVAVDG